MEDDSESKQSRILSFLANQNALKSLSRRPWFCSQQIQISEWNPPNHTFWDHSPHRTNCININKTKGKDHNSTRQYLWVNPFVNRSQNVESGEWNARRISIHLSHRRKTPTFANSAKISITAIAIDNIMRRTIASSQIELSTPSHNLNSTDNISNPNQKSK